MTTTPKGSLALAAFPAGLLFALAPVAPAQTCQVCGPQMAQLKNDALPLQPCGQQGIAAIRGLCVGDKAAVVFDLRGLPGTVQVMRGGVLFAGPAGSAPARGTLEIYDGVSFNNQGRAAPGFLLHRSSQPQSLALNTLTSEDVSSSNVVISSGLLVVAWELNANPNGVCALGYSANIASDTQLPPGSACVTPPRENLIFDPGNGGWWDVTQFRIGGIPWCGLAFNGSWVIRACIRVSDPALLGTQEDLILESGVGTAPSNGDGIQTVEAGSLLSVLVRSPNGGFAGVPGFLMVDGFANAGPPLVPVVPDIFGGSSLALTSLGPIPAPGASLMFTVPPGFERSTFVLQGLSLAPARAANGIFASSRAHLVVVQ